MRVMLNSLKIILICSIITCELNAAASTSSASSSSSAECSARPVVCDDNKNRPVCGTDDKTYNSKCHLQRARCQGYNVTMKYRGDCKDGCSASRDYALSRRGKLKYIPKCRQDGSYAPIQCLESNQCWCVNNQGTPISQTVLGKPNCVVILKGNQKRSSPVINNPPRRKCTPSDRVAFNSDLTKIFHTEYSKSKASRNRELSDHQITDWKFSQLDLNRNNMLENGEFQVLRKIARKIVKPKRCGRRFGKYCDKDNNAVIGRDEFIRCLSKSLQQHTQNRDVNHGKVNGVVDLDDEELTEEDSEESTIQRNSNNRLGLKDKTTLNLQNESDGNSRDHEDEINDCKKDRKIALEDKSDQLFLPECTPDGRFKRVQCYRSTGYCWCANEDSGKPIPGSSIKDQTPQCDLFSYVRSMPGCPKKNEFLKDLKEFLRSQTFVNSSIISSNSTKWGTEDEKIATLSFVLLDKNKNKVWERKEWKTFRDLVDGIKKLRRCGKRLPRFCDGNNDRKITLSEWLNCLQTQRIENDSRHSSPQELKPFSSSQPKLRGINPLEFILKAD